MSLRTNILLVLALAAGVAYGWFVQDTCRPSSAESAGRNSSVEQSDVDDEEAFIGKGEEGFEGRAASADSLAASGYNPQPVAHSMAAVGLAKPSP